MSITYLIVSPPDSPQLKAAGRQLQKDINDGNHITQIFFYSDGVEIGEKNSYPDTAKALLSLAETHQIPLYLCSAGFQKRQLILSAVAREEFIFRGVGQFVAESQTATHIRTF